MAKHFNTDLKNNIVCLFNSQDVVSAFNIFDREKMPLLGTTDLSCYGEDCIDNILKHYGKDLTAESVIAEESIKQLWFPLISLRNGNASKIHRSTAQGGHEGTT